MEGGPFIAPSVAFAKAKEACKITPLSAGTRFGALLRASSQNV
jgi:hypothetical protein